MLSIPPAHGQYCTRDEGAGGKALRCPFFAAAPSAADTARSQQPSAAVPEDHSLDGTADWPPSTPAFLCASLDKSSAE